MKQSKCFPALAQWVKDGSSEYTRDGLQTVLKRSNDAKVSSTAPNAPEQLRVFCLAGNKQLTVRSDHISRKQVIAGKTVLAREPSIPERHRRLRCSAR
jgi:hypothetical protein